MEKEYFICFYETGTTTVYSGNGSEGEETNYNEGELKKVNDEEMFEWLEYSHTNNIKISIYSAKMVCDLS